ncbi:MAG: glycosyltransferase [Candidatus Andersenbacteria bacterium]
MHIFFIGQQGIPAQDASDATERRVEAIASYLGQKGYSVTIACKHSYAPTTVRFVGTARLYRPLRLVPDFVGILWHVWRERPDVVHIQDWKMAWIVRLAALLSPESTYVWTIGKRPPRWRMARIAAWQARSAFDAITVPERHLQYLLLVRLGLRTTYIPDGYTPPHIPRIPASHWKLRKNQYVFTTASTFQDVEWVAQAHKATGSRKRLVVPGEVTEFKRLKRKYPFLINIPLPGKRAILSLIQQAGVVIALDADEWLLPAMDAGRPIIAVGNPAIEEIIGTTGQIVAPDDEESLSTALRKALKGPKSLALMTKKSATRAQAHFRWQRVFEEYSALYHYPAIQRIPLDSAFPRQRAVISA